jgi:hypothetical protein
MADPTPQDPKENDTQQGELQQLVQKAVKTWNAWADKDLRSRLANWNKNGQQGDKPEKNKPEWVKNPASIKSKSDLEQAISNWADSDDPTLKKAYSEITEPKETESKPQEDEPQEEEPQEEPEETEGTEDEPQEPDEGDKPEEPEEGDTEGENDNEPKTKEQKAFETERRRVETTKILQSAISDLIKALFPKFNIQDNGEDYNSKLESLEKGLKLAKESSKILNQSKEVLQQTEQARNDAKDAAQEKFNKKLEELKDPKNAPDWYKETNNKFQSKVKEHENNFASRIKSEGDTAQKYLDKLRDLDNPNISPEEKDMLSRLTAPEIDELKKQVEHLKTLEELETLKNKEDRTYEDDVAIGKLWDKLGYELPQDDEFQVLVNEFTEINQRYSEWKKDEEARLQSDFESAQRLADAEFEVGRKEMEEAAKAMEKAISKQLKNFKSNSGTPEDEREFGRALLQYNHVLDRQTKRFEAKLGQNESKALRRFKKSKRLYEQKIQRGYLKLLKAVLEDI